MLQRWCALEQKTRQAHEFNVHVKVGIQEAEMPLLPEPLPFLPNILSHSNTVVANTERALCPGHTLAVNERAASANAWNLKNAA